MRAIKNLRKYKDLFFLNTLSASHICPMNIRLRLLRMFGHQIKGALYSDYFMGIGGGRLKIGKNSFCNCRCFFDLSNDIFVGDNCSIAFGVAFVTSSHEIGPHQKRAGGGKNSPIVVEDGCWIGANVTILPGVTVTKGCIIAAGAVVIESTEPDGLYAGVPARRIKELI